METSGLSGGMMPGMASGLLGLDVPLHNPQRQHRQLYQNQQQQHHNHHQILSFTSHEANQQSQQSMKQQPPYSNSGNKGKQHHQQQQQQQQQVLSDEEEGAGCIGDDAIGGEARKRVSPWQRVKWTDNMIRLLIVAVFYVEDDGGQEGINDQSGGSSNKKRFGGGLLQKKGKWKSVSRAMMDKGFFVSPQQCEDKFNDLNKRYKRVNEILGKGTACRVVENQSLLDTMDHLSPKMKEEARKLLNSKHLFFREMCAYHNSCGTAPAHPSSEAATTMEHSHYQQPPQHCLHLANGGGGRLSNSRSKVEIEGLRMLKEGSRGEDDDEDGENSGEDDDEDEEDEDYGDDEDEEINGGGLEDEDENKRFSSRKRRRKEVSSSSSLWLPSPEMPSFQQLSCELMSVTQDGSKSPLEQRQWVRSRWMQLEEQQLSFRVQAYELEKQRLKWVKFSMKKEREMERTKLNNERMRLENERLVLLLRQKELELHDFHRQEDSLNPKRVDPSSVTG